MNPFKIIACDLGPNIFLQDVILSLKLLLGCYDKTAVQKLEDKMTGVAFNSGRSAMLAILNSLKLQPGDEVLVQAYTCVAVPDAVLWAGGQPVFVDIKENFNMDPQDLEKKITPRSKVIVVQHTFGIPAPLNEILKIARKRHLFVIEDCAHSLGVNTSYSRVDAAFFSFGRDKMISSVFGGLAKVKDKKLAQNLRNYQQGLNSPSYFWTAQQLLYNPLTFLVASTYYLLELGKLLHFLSQKLNLVSKAVLDMEKKGQKPNFIPQKMSQALANLALLQLKRLPLFHQRRIKVAKSYARELNNLPIKHPPIKTPLLRYTILVENPQKLISFARKHGVYLGNWYDSVVSPQGTDLKAVAYKMGSCPMSEEVAEKSVNLPTNPNLSDEDVAKAVKVIRDYYVQN